MRLRQNRQLRRQYAEEDINPMEGVGNMADAMLVFACGILLALIISWNVEISERGEISQQGTKYEVENIGQQAAQAIDPETELEEMGKVYRDPETGKYYVIED